MAQQKGKKNIIVQMMKKHASQGIHPGFETDDRRHQKCKNGISFLASPPPSFPPKNYRPTKCLLKGNGIFYTELSHVEVACLNTTASEVIRRSEHRHRRMVKILVDAG